MELQDLIKRGLLLARDGLDYGLGGVRQGRLLGHHVPHHALGRDLLHLPLDGDGRLEQERLGHLLLVDGVVLLLLLVTGLIIKRVIDLGLVVPRVEGDVRRN